MNVANDKVVNIWLLLETNYIYGEISRVILVNMIFLHFKKWVLYI